MNKILIDKELEKDLTHFFDIKCENINQSIFKSNENTNTLSSDVTEYTLSLNIKEFSDEKEAKRYMTSIEKQIRTSPEYHIWTEYIRQILEKNQCQVTGELNNQARCEIHHHPITLYSMINGIINKKINNGIEFCSYDISKEIMELHFKMKAPFVMLVKSMHEKHHNGYLSLPMNLVYGDYKHFMKEYYPYLTEDEATIIDEKLKINKENCGWWNKSIWLKKGNDDNLED